MVGSVVHSARAAPACTTNRPVCTVKTAATSGGVCNMWTMSIHDNFRVATFPSADAAGAAALEFLERSREVANEVVVDDSRAKTSPSGREKDSHSRSGPAV